MKKQTDFSLFYAAMAADDAYQSELVRAYGKRQAADARYRCEHDDAAVTRAMERKLAADVAWLREMQRKS